MTVQLWHIIYKLTYIWYIHILGYLNKSNNDNILFDMYKSKIEVATIYFH